jgi:hypothetical protein
LCIDDLSYKYFSFLCRRENSNSSKDNEAQRNGLSSYGANREMCKYFGTAQESEDVKSFVQLYHQSDIVTIVSSLVYNLSSNCKGIWPKGLSSLFLELCKLIRYNLFTFLVSSVFESVKCVFVDVSFIFTVLPLPHITGRQNCSLILLSK